MDEKLHEFLEKNYGNSRAKTEVPAKTKETINKKYCINTDCPFGYCERHIEGMPKKSGTYTFCDFDATCKKYISWLLSEVSGQ